MTPGASGALRRPSEGPLLRSGIARERKRDSPPKKLSTLDTMVPNAKHTHYSLNTSIQGTDHER
ncbi:MAG: hypothetical protein DHS20C07_30540 [Methyloligella sp.]|nr:MAG: hypothetical protein DHS20C07_30540 [Methyloligella sp.]